MEAGRGDGHRGAHVVDDHLGHAEAERALDDERGGAARHRVGGEVVPVAGEAGHAEEQRSRDDRAVVVGQGDDIHRGPVAEQVAQRHARETLATAPAAASPAASRRGLAPRRLVELPGGRRSGADECEQHDEGERLP